MAPDLNVPNVLWCSELGLVPAAIAAILGHGSELPQSPGLLEPGVLVLAHLQLIHL